MRKEIEKIIRSRSQYAYAPDHVIEAEVNRRMGVDAAPENIEEETVHEKPMVLRDPTNNDTAVANWAEIISLANNADNQVATPDDDEAPVDITAINGVGPKIKVKLEEIGITSLEQVAEMSEEEVVEIDDKLSFKGRIEREGWISQARSLLGRS